MKFTVFLSLIVIFLMGCGKKQTLAQREGDQHKTRAEFIERYPSFEIQNKIMHGGAVVKNGVKSEIKNYSIVTLPVVGVMTGVTSLSGLTELGALGLLSNTISWMSHDSQLVRAKIKDMDTFYRPDLTFIRTSSKSYKELFLEAENVMRSNSSKFKACRLSGVIEEGTNYAHAYAFHFEGEYWSRNYLCGSEEEGVSQRVIIFSEATPDGSRALVRIRRWIIGDLKNDASAQSEEFAFKMYNETEHFPKGWGLFYSGHEERLDWEWKNYYRDSEANVFEFDAPIYPDKKMNEGRQSQISKRIEFYKNEKSKSAKTVAL